MKLVVITGNTGVGKSTYARRLLEKATQPVVFDINKEYREFKNNFFETEKLLSFLEKRKNCTVLIDEATAFFSYRGFDSDLNRLLQLRRHRNHFFIFIYHSINFVPAYLRRYVNYFVFFQQNCNEQILKELNLTKEVIPLKPFEYKVIKIM